MSWKEFFKPEWKKFTIVLILLILYLSFILARSLVATSVCVVDRGVCTNGFWRIYENIVISNKSCNAYEINKSYASYMESSNTSFSSLDRFLKVLDKQSFPITLGFGLPILGISGISDIYGSIILIVYWYLLACMIVWVFSSICRKIKNNNSRGKKR